DFKLRQGKVQRGERAAPVVKQINVTLRIGAEDAAEAEECCRIPVTCGAAYRIFFRLPFEALIANVAIGGFEDALRLLKQGIDGDGLAFSAAWRQKVLQIAFRGLSLLHLAADDGKRPVWRFL